MRVMALVYHPSYDGTATILSGTWFHMIAQQLSFPVLDARFILLVVALQQANKQGSKLARFDKAHFRIILTLKQNMSALVRESARWIAEHRYGHMITDPCCCNLLLILYIYLSLYCTTNVTNASTPANRVDWGDLHLLIIMYYYLIIAL